MKLLRRNAFRDAFGNSQECIDDQEDNVSAFAFTPEQDWLMELVENRVVHHIASHLEQNRTEAHELAAKFSALTDRWRRETAMLSLETQKTSSMPYLQIIAMGEKALPFIFQQLLERRRYWFTALEAITGNNPVPQGADFDRAVTAWLSWAANQGHLKHVSA